MRARAEGEAAILAVAIAVGMIGCRGAADAPTREELEAQWAIARTGVRPAPVLFRFLREDADTFLVCDEFWTDSGHICLPRGRIDIRPVTARAYEVYLRGTGLEVPPPTGGWDAPIAVSFAEAQAYARWAGGEIPGFGDIRRSFSGGTPGRARPASSSLREWCMVGDREGSVATFVADETGAHGRFAGFRTSTSPLPGEPRAAFRCYVQGNAEWKSWPLAPGDVAAVTPDPSCPPSGPVVK